MTSTGSATGLLIQAMNACWRRPTLGTEPGCSRRGRGRRVRLPSETGGAGQGRPHIDAGLLYPVDTLVSERRVRNRSQAVESTLAEKLGRLSRTRLATECAKLDPALEPRLADEGLEGESWPEY